MTTQRAGSRAKSRNWTSTQQNVLSPEEVKTRLRERGLTLKQWAEQNKYPYDTVSCVVRGVNRGTFGLGYRIAVELGLKTKEAA